jgi:hypothetical protein
MGGTIPRPATRGKSLLENADVLAPRFEFALDRRDSSC